MPKAPKKRASKPKQDYIQVAFRVFKVAIGEAPPIPERSLPPRSAAGQKGGLKGGKARAAKLTKARRVEIAKQAAQARWHRT